MSLIFTHRYDASVQFDSVKANEANDSKSRFTRSSLRLTAQRQRFGLDHLHVRRDGARRDTTFSSWCASLIFSLSAWDDMTLLQVDSLCPGTHTHTHTPGQHPDPKRCIASQLHHRRPKTKYLFFFFFSTSSSTKRSFHQKRVLW